MKIAIVIPSGPGPWLRLPLGSVRALPCKRLLGCSRCRDVRQERYGSEALSMAWLSSQAVAFHGSFSEPRTASRRVSVADRFGT
jgi:hypothetical protein